MSLAPYISDLLYNHDCVIVPNFGGFVANYKPAKINDLQNTFSPPSKSITFNKHLTNNDGLLANYIAQKEHLSYPNACKRITDYVATIHAELKSENKTTLEKIGSFNVDASGNFLFEPDLAVNYLLDSFGLSSFQKLPIKRTTIEDKITKEFKDRTAPLVAVAENKKSSKKWMVAAAITIPLAFFAIWIPSKYDLGADINYANLNPFKPDAKAVYEPSKHQLGFQEVEEGEGIKNQIALVDENAYFLNVTINQSDFVVKLKEHEAEAVSTYVASNKQDLNYHIVGGCFSSKTNARKMVRRLKKEGFEASIIGKRKGLWTVSYSSFATRKEAVSFLAEAKYHNTKAWVLNY
jgi:nucleoid DNA-binding protein